MDDKDPKDMTASELLRSIAGRCRTEGLGLMGEVELLRRTFGAERNKYHCEIDMVNALIAIADEIDAELAQVRADELRHLASIWAKANGWPGFREGEVFSAWLDRCAIPRPRFEDGEPVQSSDMEEIGALATCRVYMDGSWEFDPDKYEDERNPKPWDVQSGAKSDRIKRPAPDTLGADGLPIKVGETVWNIFSGIEGIIKALNLNGESTAYVEWRDGRWSPGVLCDRLTHTPPDTQERIDADARKDTSDYWKCWGIDCEERPSIVDGSKPYERYGASSCRKAMTIDLLRRQREMDERKGGE